MNKNYRVIWNHSQGNYVVTSELARGKVKSSRSSTARRLTAGCVATAFMALASVGIIQPALADPAYGEYASGAGNIINIQDKDVATSDDSAHALFVEKGATAHSNNMNFTTSGKKAFGVNVDGAGSSIDIRGGTITTTGAQGYGLVAGNGGKLMASDVTLNTSSVGVYADKSKILARNLSVQANGYGIYGINQGAKIVIADSNVNVSGNDAYALLAEDGGNVTSTNSHYTTSGKNVYGAWVNKGSELTIIGGSITNTGNGSTGILAKSGGRLNVDGVTVVSTSQGINSYSSAVANVANSHVTVTGKEAYGLLAENGGKMTSTDSHYITTGDNAYGTWVNTGSELNIFGGSITTTGKAGYGMFAKNGGILNAENVSIDSQGVGVQASNKSTISLKDVQVKSVGHGIYANQSMTDAENMQIDAGGYGVWAKSEGARININNSTISSAATLGGAITASSKGLANVRNSKLIALDSDSAGIYANYSGQVDAEGVDIEIMNSGNGAQSTYSGVINIINSKIESHSGGNVFQAESGSVLTADNVFAEMDNNNNPEEIVTAIHIANAYVSSADPTANINNSFLHIKGNNAAGIVTSYTKGEINLNNTILTVDNGPAIVAYNQALTTVNLDNSLLSGTTLLETGLNPYGGDAGADVRGITVNASNHSQLQGDANIDRSKTQASSVSLDSGSRWQGAAHDLQDLSLAGSSQWNMTGSSTVDSLTAKDSTIIFDHSAGDFHTLTVKGDYHADNAKLVMNLALAGDDAASDKLHIAGNASGTTKVQVHNAGGKGAATLEGIELIRVEGTQNGEFLQDGRIVGGAWDYALVQDKNGKWRLVSDPIPVDPTPVDPIKDEGGDTGTVIAPEVPQPKRTPRARPEVGSYIANLAAASKLFTLSAADRPGVTEYRDALTGKVEKTTLWLRNEGAHGRFSDSTAQLKSITNSYMTQLGGDIAQWSLNGSDRFSLGVMAGYGNAKSNTLSKTTGYSAKGQVNGYSGGIYAGWQQDSQTRSGAFVDSWLAYNTFNNSVKGEGLGQESYKSKGMTASLEGGYSFAFGEQQQYRLQPKAQAVWMGVKTGDYTEQNGTRVSATGNNNVQTRTGVRATMHTATAQPYAEVNWLHNTQRFGSKLDGVKIEQAGARNIGEVKLGLEVNPSQHVGIWGGIAQQVGGKGFSDSSAALGVKVSF
ncbi:autotransporter outer membrane beta-barrel domain-containing protein [Pantoea sp. SO10]|uniref:autotransporter outer membrane beta-barrel domain-containing protein n=1 Tax=Pantoea sp. SO10 TaxID=2575375 RepID=UPI00143D78A1|nr:autotransporter outer membrane beta-barrel domain-containing protein [Pantoea sp. SO10]